jgi:predicted Zn-dependent protease
MTNMRHLSLKHIVRSLCLTVVSGILFSACGAVPLTGRKQILLVSDQEIFQAGLVQYKEYLNTAVISSDQASTDIVKGVGRKLADATEMYLRASGLEHEIANFDWEFNLIKDSQINAFCMPGGKIVVYEGLLSVARTPDELAVVLGHEIAHAVAKHSNERMSQQILTQYGIALISSALSEKSVAVRDLATTVFGLGAKVGMMLPYSRKHEYEADYMGIVFMELAGYDSDSSVTFWKKMAELGESSVPEILSTHPSDDKRIANLELKIAEAKTIAESMR